MGLQYCTALSAQEIFTEKDEKGKKNQTGLLVVGTLFVHTGILQEWREGNVEGAILGLQWVEDIRGGCSLVKSQHPGLFLDRK